MKIIWTLKATKSVADIRDYIAEDNPVLAESWIRKLIESIEEQLTIFPESGQVVEALNNSNIRELIRGSYRVIY